MLLKHLHTRFLLLTLSVSLALISCAPHHTDSTPKSTAPIAPSSNIQAPINVDNKVLAFEINTTKIITGSEPRLFSDGNFKSYFTANKMFTDARNYNGLSWSSDYQYAAQANQATITQELKWEMNGVNNKSTLKTQLTYLSPTSGTFAMDVNYSAGILSEVRYSHSGTFTFIDQQLDILEKGMASSGLNLFFQTISNNTKGFELKAGSEIVMYFIDPHYGNFTFNNKLYETRDYQLISVDAFTRRIQGTLTDNQPFEIVLHFEQFLGGKFEVNIDNNGLKASGGFFISRWIPVANYKVEGQFTDGLKYVSKHTKIEYPYSVYLPPNYANSQKKYPVLYSTDGQWAKEYYKIVEGHHREFIVVAIEQGPENRRMTDYQLPGATAYTRFLKEELIPHIESQYRTDNHRLFWGSSLGGTLGEILLSQETEAQPYFTTYAIADGAFWANPQGVRNALKTNLAHAKAEKISIFGSGSRQGNYLSNQDFFARLQSLNNSSLTLTSIELKETHTEMATPSFEAFIDAMR